MPTFPDHALDRRAGFVEQRGLLQDFGLAAHAALGADIGVVGVAPAIRTEIGLGLDERTRIGDDVQDALIETFGRDRLGEKFGDAGVARISSGWMTDSCAASSRARNSCGLNSFIRKPTVPRCMP